MSDSKELSVPERAAVALGATEHEKALLVLATKYADITKIVNPAGREQCHAAYMELKTTRVSIEKAGKDAREDANAFQKAVIKEVERLTAITAAEESRLQVLRDAYDAEREAERQAKAAAEKVRVDTIRRRIAEMQSIPAMLIGKSSETIAAAIESLEAVEITLETHQEFAGEGEVAKLATVQKLWEMFKAQQEHEAEAARLQQEREQLARERIEAEERERIAAAARAKQQAADRAERERIETEQRAANERAAALLREQQEAHEARMRAERAEIQRQQDEINAAREEQERIAREARKAAELEARRLIVVAEAKRQAEEQDRIAEAQRIADEQAAEARRVQAEKDAAEAERVRRERVQFVLNGPGDMEIALTLASHYQVAIGDAMQWLKKFDYEATDEQFAAMNATGSLPHLDQAA